MHRLGSLLGTTCVLIGCASSDEDNVTVTSQAMMDHEMEMDCSGPAPIMLDGDFDGDGRITPTDLQALNDFRQSGDYAAFFDMNADGALNGLDVSAVAGNMGRTSSRRDQQMAELWRTTSPYRDVRNARAAGYVPFTPDLMGHGMHWANFRLILSWGARTGNGSRFLAGQPEGLNYTEDGRLVAAFYYQPGAVDLSTVGQPVPPTTYYKALPVRPSLDGVILDNWHDHIGPCFGGATMPVPGFDQCMTLRECKGPGSVPFPASLGGAGPTGGVYGQLWSPGFHMLHVWMFEYNACGPFSGLDEEVSPMAPMEPNHEACTIADVVPVLVP